MWAAIATPASTPPWPQNSSVGFTMKAPRNNYAFIVSAKYQRRSRRRNDHSNYDYDDDDDDDDDDDEEDEDEDIEQENIGGLGLTNVRSKPAVYAIRGTSIKTSNSNWIRPKQETEEDRQKQPSGSDILRALQRASVRKQKKKKLKLNTSSSPIVDVEVKEEKRYSRHPHHANNNVRQLRIKTDWSNRLDQLEMRLQELLIF